MTSDNNIFPLFPNNPVQAHELFENDSNKVQDEGKLSKKTEIPEDIDNQAMQQEMKKRLISTQTVNMLLKLLEATGYDTPVKPEDEKDLCLVAEAVVSLLDKFEGMAHPMQVIANKAIKLVYDDEFLTYNFDSTNLMTISLEDNFALTFDVYDPSNTE